MGVGSSKHKGSNVTLISNSSTVQSTATGSTVESTATGSTMQSTVTDSTPQRGKFLSLDPRSPAESFTRTPITVGVAGETSTPAGTSVRVLDVDPRSTSQEVSRTPIVVESEKKASSKLHFQDKLIVSICGAGYSAAAPTALALKSSLANIRTSDDTTCKEDTQDDPRSPTVSVPRTPLSDRQFDVSTTEDDNRSVTKLVFNQSTDDASQVEDEGELQELEAVSLSDAKTAKQNDCEKAGTSKKDANNLQGANDDSESSEEQGSPVRRPLSNLQPSYNSNARGTPRALLQAKQCRTLEEEFNKNQRDILSQLEQYDDGENVAPVVATATQFVEEI